ncbi:hypothetical protein GCM10028813_50260 [Ramlibacter alkalitolerans]
MFQPDVLARGKRRPQASGHSAAPEPGTADEATVGPERAWRSVEKRQEMRLFRRFPRGSAQEAEHLLRQLVGL